MHTALEEEEITEQLKELSEWYYEKGKLVKCFTFNNFREAMSFLITVSYEAEEKNHHPEIHSCYNRISFSLSTHDAGNRVTIKDFDLARAIDKIS